MTTTPPNPPVQPVPHTPIEQPSPQIEKNKHRTLLLFTLALVLAGLTWFCLWFFYLSYYEYTDDAYANGNLININSPVSGSVIAFYADDTDLVEEGQLLVSLDPTDFQIKFDRELASLASVVLQVRQLYDNVVTNQAAVDSRRVALQKAQYDYENRSALVNTKAISNEDYTHAKDTFSTAEFDLKQAEAQLQGAKDAAGNTPLLLHPLIEQQKARVREAYYNLSHTSIFAPATGYIAQRSVDVGEWVTPPKALMAIIPTNYVWVDANYKETQLTDMRVGQPATVTFDIYGSKVKYEGKVLGIASGSGSVFSLIPPQNATGNWIKIVQRLPVRISLDPETVKKYPVRLGISAEVNVDITNQDLPMLANAPSIKTVGTTNVFELNMGDVEKVIDKVIFKNLNKEKASQNGS